MRKSIREKGFSFSSDYAMSVEQNFYSRGCAKLLDYPPPGIMNVAREFYANFIRSENGTSTVQRNKVDFSRDGINRFLGTPIVNNNDYNHFSTRTIDYANVFHYLCTKGAR